MFCPNCNIGIDYIQMRSRKCNNCLHEWVNIHVLPVDDIKNHLETYDCHCNPTIEDESGNIIIIHNSFDGREGVEWANEILNQ